MWPDNLTDSELLDIAAELDLQTLVEIVTSPAPEGAAEHSCDS